MQTGWGWELCKKKNIYIYIYIYISYQPYTFEMQFMWDSDSHKLNKLSTCKKKKRVWKIRSNDPGVFVRNDHTDEDIKGMLKDKHV